MCAFLCNALTVLAKNSGVGTSGLEMSQNSQGLAWTREEVDKQLESIMELIHRFSFSFVKTCVCLCIWIHVCMQQVYIYMRIYSTHAHKYMYLQ